MPVRLVTRITGRADSGMWFRWFLISVSLQLVASLGLASYYFAMAGRQEDLLLATHRIVSWAMLATSMAILPWVTARRLNDADLSGWHQVWVVAALLGLGRLGEAGAMLALGLAFLAIGFLAFAPGSQDANRFGPACA